MIMRWTGRVVLLLLLVLMLPGCAIYGVAVEERKAGTIAADNKIALTIQKAFIADDDIKALDISVYCYNGHVYLVGEYDRASQKERAAAIAKGTAGVRSVETYVLPKKKNDPCGTGDNLAIRAKLDSKLVGDKEIRSTNIDVKVVQCRIVLLGIVKTKNEITRAAAHARAVEGSRGVVSYLKSAH